MRRNWRDVEGLLDRRDERPAYKGSADLTAQRSIREYRSNENDGRNSMNAGDRPYIPAGGLQLWTNRDGTVGSGLSLAIDPWLPDLSLDAGTPVDVIQAIARRGFTVSAICTSKSINACQRTREVGELLSHPEVARLRHMAVSDDMQVIGILDLDRARGQVRHDDERPSLVVEDILEPLSEDNTLRGDSPLIDYILTSDARPFRLVKLPGNKVGTIDIEDLQKLPVRVLLLMYFLQLEDMVVRRLCESDSDMLEQIRYEGGVDAEPLGNSGAGPVRRIEPYGFRELLRTARNRGILTLPQGELPFLERYRNALAHGPRWYITRRKDAGALVRCFKRVLALIQQCSATSGTEQPSAPEGV